MLDSGQAERQFKFATVSAVFLFCFFLLTRSVLVQIPLSPRAPGQSCFDTSQGGSLKPSDQKKKMKKKNFCILLSKVYNISAHPPARNKGGWREGRDPPGLLRRQPHASIRKLESTPTPTGYVETLTPASRPHKEDSNTCKGNNPNAYLCTDTYYVNRSTRVHHPGCSKPMQYHG